jgi:hypothetical protein
LGGNISECGVGRLACRLDHVALDARDETVDRKVTHRRIQQVEARVGCGRLERAKASLKPKGLRRYARIWVALRPAELDDDVLPLDEAALYLSFT